MSPIAGKKKFHTFLRSSPGPSAINLYSWTFRKSMLILFILKQDCKQNILQLQAFRGLDKNMTVDL